MTTVVKERRMKRTDLDELVRCYNLDNHNLRKPLWDEKENTEDRWRAFS